MSMTKDDLLALYLSLEKEAADALEKLNMARGALQLLDHLLSEYYANPEDDEENDESKRKPKKKKKG